MQPPPPPPPPPSPSGLIEEAEGCAAPAGSAVCEGRARVTVANVAGAVLEVGDGGSVASIPVAGSGEFRFALPGAPRKHPLRLRSGTQVLDGADGQKTAEKRCAPGSLWDSGVYTGRSPVPPQCREVLAHSDEVVATWDKSRRFYFVDENTAKPEGERGFTAVTNRTPWNDFENLYFYYFSGIAKVGTFGPGVADEFCRIRVVAVDSVERQWRQLYIDPVRRELRVLPGTETVRDFDPRDQYDFAQAGGANATVTRGEFYSAPSDPRFNHDQLWFKASGASAATLVRQWTIDEFGNLYLMRASSCSAASASN
ncbi:MAG: hypothetical protein KF863_07410 [Rubrivivax sp.]|nr:hypothetical protein [Rubrivivax sp.]